MGRPKEGGQPGSKASAKLQSAAAVLREKADQYYYDIKIKDPDTGRYHYWTQVSLDEAPDIHEFCYEKGGEDKTFIITVRDADGQVAKDPKTGNLMDKLRIPPRVVPERPGSSAQRDPDNDDDDYLNTIEEEIKRRTKELRFKRRKKELERMEEELDDDDDDDERGVDPRLSFLYQQQMRGQSSPWNDPKMILAFAKVLEVIRPPAPPTPVDPITRLVELIPLFKLFMGQKSSGMDMNGVLEMVKPFMASMGQLNSQAQTELLKTFSTGNQAIMKKVVQMAGESDEGWSGKIGKLIEVLPDVVDKIPKIATPAPSIGHPGQRVPPVQLAPRPVPPRIPAARPRPAQPGAPAGAPPAPAGSPPPLPPPQAAPAPQAPPPPPPQEQPTGELPPAPPAPDQNYMSDLLKTRVRVFLLAVEQECTAQSDAFQIAEAMKKEGHWGYLPLQLRTLIEKAAENLDQPVAVQIEELNILMDSFRQYDPEMTDRVEKLVSSSPIEYGEWLKDLIDGLTSDSQVDDDDDDDQGGLALAGSDESQEDFGEESPDSPEPPEEQENFGETSPESPKSPESPEPPEEKPEE
jgi:hypothetical protein